MAKKSRKPTAADVKKARTDKIESILVESRKLFGDEAAGTLRGIHASLGGGVKDWISSGSIQLDEVLGGRGYPCGRIIEIFGMESSGKTTLSLHAIAEAQKTGKICGFIDAEHALDPGYAQALGVNLEEILFSQPANGEEALQIAESWAKSGAVSLIVIDSVAALTPRRELEGEIGDQHVGLQARLMSQALRILTGHCNNNNCSIIFINQIRMKIGVTYGSPKTTPGGNALKFYASQRLEVSRVGSLKKGDDVYANKTKVKVVKNKTAPPFKTCEFEIRFGEGIAWASEVLDIGVSLKIMSRAGAWYKHDGKSIGMGRDNAVDWLKDNPDVVSAIKAARSAQ